MRTQYNGNLFEIVARKGGTIAEITLVQGQMYNGEDHWYVSMDKANDFIRTYGKEK